MDSFYHLPVMPDECIRALNIKSGGTYVDATLGGGGHSELIAGRLTTGRLICLDKDAEAIEAGRRRLSGYQNVSLIKTDFRDMRRALKQHGIESIDGALFDLGVSSRQLDAGERGFSYMQDAKLDMRMDRDQSYSASELVNEEDEAELRRILYEYGEEKQAGRIAAAIVRARPVNTTLELAEIIKEAMPARARREKQHPAKRSFQAFRIAVNSELEAAREGIRAASALLAPGGRIAVITFHSLEDRLVKKFFRDMSKGCTCPPEFPICVCGTTPVLRQPERKPATASEAELERNPRARSAKLRWAEKIAQQI
jgi:16S rRNA (cytosine1402-N4)-methyltransferase